MIKLKNNRLLQTIRREPVDTTPVWIMRQAGRYLPEYNVIRQKAGSFTALCKTPELACEVTLQPIRRFPLDAAILFSDILTIPDAMGLGLFLKEKEGPVFERPVRSKREILALGIPDPEQDLRYVLDAITLIQHELAGSIPLIGFCGSPWTMAAYMVEGCANKSFPAIHALMQEQPQLLHYLLDLLAQSVILHLNAQIKAGVQAVMLFDTWGGLLDTPHYKEYSLRYCKQIIENVDAAAPLILFTKQGGQWLEEIAQSGCAVVGVDGLVNLTQARQRVGDKVALQGNLDPSVLYQSPEIIQAEVARVLADYGKGPGHIFNLGHGIPKDVLPEKVGIVVEAVHTLSQLYHQ